MNLFFDISCQFLYSLVVAGIFAAIYLRFKGINAYTRKFSFTMVAVSFLMVAILNSVGGSIAVSISLFGALSLLRFRSLVRDTDDMAFLFVSLTSGLAAGTGQFVVLVFVLIAFCLLIFVFKFLEQHEADKDLMFIDITLNDGASSDSVVEMVRLLGVAGLALVSITENQQKSINRYKFKCNQTEEQAIVLLGQIKQIPGVFRCTLMSNDAQ